MRIQDDRRRGRGSIKTRLTAVVVFSAVALVAMWAVVSVPRLLDALYLKAMSAGMQDVMPVAVASLTSVQEERALSLVTLSAPGGPPSAELSERRRQTDQVFGRLVSVFGPSLDQTPDQVRTKFDELKGAFGELKSVRGKIDGRSIDRPRLFDAYDKCADASLALFDMMARLAPDQVTSYGSIEVDALFRAGEQMARAIAIISSANITGTLTAADQANYARLVGAYHYQLEISEPYISDNVRSRYQTLLGSDSWRKLVAAEDTLIERGSWTVVTNASKRTDGQLAAPPVADQEWRDVTGKVAGEVKQLGFTQFADVTKVATDRAGSALLNAIVGSVLALLAAIIAIVTAVKIMRTTSRRLTGLRYETLDLAVEKLPPIVQRLRDGERVDVVTELPALDYGNDEIGQVARAFNAAHSTAIAAAVQESRSRAGIRNVFLGIAHRSQALVHRQLKILDELEREQEDPQQLDQLFKLDHLATRARRNAENLIILGGQQPGRSWRRPVLLGDILRGATAETTQYTRVRMQGVPRVWVKGGAVADTMHLVAELLDNATSFSPPRAQVRLYGERAAKGIVVEVEDNGLGMDDDDRERANVLLADPPDFDSMALKGDPRLGLFVVARLALRHGISVELRSSSYGGSRAIVLIPSELLVEVDEQAGDDMPASRPGGPPDPDLADDALPFRVSLFTPPEQRAQAVQVLSEAPPEPVWPEQEPAPEPVEEPEPVREVERPPAAEPPPPSVNGDRPVLPRRRRQASLAPQLRETNTFTPVDDEVGTEDAGRSADEIRDIMSDFQRHSRRARDEDAGE